MARAFSKNNWALFLLLLTGIVAGSFFGHLAREISFLKWLDYGMNFAIGDTNNRNIVTLDLSVLVIHFGLRLRVTIGSALGAAAAIFVYKKV